MYSNVEVIGRLTRDPELRNTGNGTPVTNFSIAVNDFNKDEASYFDVTAWSKTAETVSAFKKQGDLIMVQGKLKQERWDQDGQKRSKVIIVANQIVFLPSKNDNTSASSDGDDFGNDIPF